MAKAELAVMGAEGAVNIIHRREIAAADDDTKRNVNNWLRIQTKSATHMLLQKMDGSMMLLNQRK